MSNRVRSSIRALQDIFETSDRDIKKERATSCPAGGHWRGINHPREGLHFNAPGWISNSGEIASATTGARQSSMQPAVLCSARTRLVRCSGYRRRASLRYRCSGRRIRQAPRRGCGTTPGRRQRKFFSSIPFLFSFRSDVCHRISRRSISSPVACDRFCSRSIDRFTIITNV